MRCLPALLFLLAVACSQSEPAVSPTGPSTIPKRGGVLTLLMNQTGDPPSFDLHQESVSASMEAAGGAYDNLIMFDPQDPGAIVPDLAESWDLAPDGAGYTFRLRGPVRFHNGNSLTSADVAFTLDRVRSPSSGMASPRRPALEAISSITTPDEQTVVVRLQRPNPSLLPNLAQGWMAIYDREWVTANGQDAPKDEMMGTGPFRFKEHLRGSSLELRRNEDYWVAGRPYLDGLRYLIIPDFSTRVAAFRAGQVMVSRLFSKDAEQLRQEMGDRLRFTTQVAPSFGALMFNTRRAPFDNPQVIEAMNLAVDRHAAVALLAQGEGEVGGFMMPGGPWALSSGDVGALPGYGRDKERDRQRARDLLAGAGWGRGLEVEILTRTGLTFENLAVFAADQLKQIDVQATLRPVETVFAIELARKGEFQALTWGHEFALDDPDAVYGEFYTCEGARNYSGMCTPEVERLFQQQSRETDLEKRRALVQEMERKAVRTGTKIITHWNWRHDAMWAYVRDYLQHPSPFNNARYRDVWLDR